MSYCDYCGHDHVLTKCVCGIEEEICMCGFEHECEYLLGEKEYPTDDGCIRNVYD